MSPGWRPMQYQLLTSSLKSIAIPWLLDITSSTHRGLSCQLELGVCLWCSWTVHQLTFCCFWQLCHWTSLLCHVVLLQQSGPHTDRALDHSWEVPPWGAHVAQRTWWRSCTCSSHNSMSNLLPSPRHNPNPWMSVFVYPLYPISIPTDSSWYHPWMTPVCVLWPYRECVAGRNTSSHMACHCSINMHNYYQWLVDY